MAERGTHIERRVDVRRLEAPIGGAAHSPASFVANPADIACVA